MASSAFPAPFCCCYYCSLFIFLFFYYPCRSHAQMVPAMYVFGDSLVDVGNNNYLPLSLLKSDFPHNGVDFPGGKATGRYSNGKNAADFLAEKLGLETPPPYLSMPFASSGISALLKGVSFASGGAGILDITNKGQCLSFDKQIEFFSEVCWALLQQLGSVETQKHLSQSIIVLVIGSNDLLRYFKSYSSQPQPAEATPHPHQFVVGAEATLQQFVVSLIFTLSGQLRKIYDLGARKIVFLGTGPIGCCPSQRIHNTTRGCVTEANYASLLFNEGVNSLLQGMRVELGDMTYSFFDAYAFFMEFLQKPAAYGFADVKSACCGLGDLNAMVACLPTSACCPNRRDHVFWDSYHPTEVVSLMFADSIFHGSRPYVFPINVRQLVAF